jgi:hypothetical protein
VLFTVLEHMWNPLCLTLSCCYIIHSCVSRGEVCRPPTWLVQAKALPGEFSMERCLADFSDARGLAASFVRAVQALDDQGQLDRVKATATL